MRSATRQAVPALPATGDALPALTGLRFVAALSVVFFHYQFLIPGFANRIAPGANIVHSGFVGVSLFFVLSGFILAYTYLSPDVGMNGTLDAFWQARVARVYPVYLFALIFSAPLFVDVAFFHQVGVTHLRDVIKTAILTPLLLQGWTPKKAWMWDGPAWSLSAEAFFYLLFPFIGGWIARLRTKWIVLVAVAAYLLYLLHLPLSNYLTRIWTEVTGGAPAGLLALASFVLAAITLSVAVYWWIEVPARRRLRRWEWGFVDQVRAVARTPVRVGKL